MRNIKTTCPACGQCTISSARLIEYLRLPCRLVRSNFISNPFEGLTLSEAITAGKEQLLSMKKESDRLNRVIALIEDFQDQLERPASFKLKKELSPISRLPTEVLTLIFAAYMAELSNNTLHRSMSSSPWRLAQVCRLWRNVALSTRKLWSKFQLVAPQTERLRLSIADKRLDFCLQKSADSPLSFYFDGDIRLRAPWQKILSQCLRWEHVKISARDFLHLPPLSPIKGNIPILKSLALEYRNVHSIDALIDAFAVAPSLSSVTAINVTKLFKNLRVPWRQISTLFLKGELASGDLSNLLLSIPNIVEFSWLSATAPPAQFAPIEHEYPSIELKHLRKLTLAMNLADEFTPVFCALIAPRIASITLCVRSCYRKQSFEEALLKMVDRSSWPLTTLTVNRLSAGLVQLIAEKSPFLERLNLVDVGLEELHEHLTTILSRKEDGRTSTLSCLKEIQIQPSGYWYYSSPVEKIKILSCMTGNVLLLPPRLRRIQLLLKGVIDEAFIADVVKINRRRSKIALVLLPSSSFNYPSFGSMGR